MYIYQWVYLLLAARLHPMVMTWQIYNVTQKRTKKDFIIVQQVQNNINCLMYYTYFKNMLCSLVDDYFKFPMCAGVLAGIWPCGIITLLEELYRAEAKTQVYGSFLYANPTNTSSMSEWYIRTHVCNCIIRKKTLLYMYIRKWSYIPPDFLVYDDACHLKKFAINPTRSALTETATRIAKMNIAVDRMHFKGHVDKWCHRHCNPNDYEELRNVSKQSFHIHPAWHYFWIMQVDTQICEQTFSWLSRYARITKHMNRAHFMFYLMYLCDMHNQRKLN